MTPGKSNIVLIGMAGSGKSSVGRLLAMELNRPFVDTDDLIITSQKRPLQEILSTEGAMGFQRIEEEVLLEINLNQHVIATGGSSVYSLVGMEHLRKNGVIILLAAGLDVLKSRVGDTSQRGLVKQPSQDFAALFAERRPLYEKLAEITVYSTSLDQEGVCRAIISRLGKNYSGFFK